MVALLEDPWPRFCGTFSIRGLDGLPVFDGNGRIGGIDSVQQIVKDGLVQTDSAQHFNGGSERGRHGDKQRTAAWFADKCW